ncbi:MAG TPA: tetratricopeptide repeat protein [bacterium]|nr:tetratricopeptide repeat protein [bacterium]HNE82830.1 tetratricopeptide repeat protein [bacterium]HNO90052.1 tetratricopeptide repeat protein [bacterium]
MKRIIALVLSLCAAVSASAQWPRLSVKTAVTAIAVEDTVTWIGTNDGIRGVVNGTEKFYFDKGNGLTSNIIRAITIDNQNRKWIATEEGLNVLDGKKVKQYLKSPETLPTNEINSVHADEEGSVWIGTEKGLVRISGNSWTLLDRKTTLDGLPSNTIRGISSVWNGPVWIATDDGLVSYYNKKWALYTRKLNNLPSDDVFDVVADPSSGNVWIGTSRGVALFDGKLMTQFLSDIPVRALTLDKIGRCWVATKNEGVHLIDGARVVKYSTKEGMLVSDEGYAVTCDAFNTIWAGHQLGVQTFLDETIGSRIAPYFLTEAQKAFWSNDNTRARLYYNHIVNRSYLSATPEAATAMIGLGELYEREAMIERAADTYLRFTERFPNDARTKNLLLKSAQLQSQIKKYAESAATYQKFLTLYKDDADAFTIAWMRYNLLELAGDSVSALQTLQNLNTQFPSNPRADEIRWRILSAGNSAGVASKELRALANSTRDFEVQYQLAALYDTQHRKDILEGLQGSITWQTLFSPSAVTSIFEDGDIAWASTSGNGVVKWDIKLNALTSYSDGLKTPTVKSFYMDADRDLWAMIEGVPESNLYNMNYSKNRYKWIIQPAPFAKKTINQVLYRAKTKTTICATDQGLQIVGKGGRLVTAKNGLPSDKVKFIADDSQGILWLISDNKLVQFDKEPKMILYTGETNFTEVRGFFIDAKDNKWLATDRGLVRYDGTWKSYTQKDGLISDNVTCAAVSPSGKILTGTSSGVSYFNGTYWISYTTETGLPSNDVKAVLFTKDETVWVGTDKGIHIRKAEGDGDRVLLIRKVLAEEDSLLNIRAYDKLRTIYASVNIFGDLTEWVAYKTANTYEMEKRWDDAFQLYTKIRTDNPVTTLATDARMYRVARAFENAGESAKAMPIYFDLAERYKTYTDGNYRVEAALVRIIRNYQKENNIQRALEQARQIMAMYPRSPWLREVRSIFTQITENAPPKETSTMALLQEWLNRFPDHSDVLRLKYKLASMYWEEQQFEYAEKLYAEINSAAGTPKGLQSLLERRMAKRQLTKK